ncbi:MAG: FmdB family transcriptional regulator [Phycicoccus sp.]|nr:FmdB family transcriptional regulator [Phycicoccus sp.]
MPTYAYACTQCDHRFEIVQSFSDDSLTVCPECDGRLRKLFNSVGVVFKGGGFYRTDSRSETGSGKKASTTSPAKDSSSSSAAGSSSSSDTASSPSSSSSAGSSSTSAAAASASSTT